MANNKITAKQFEKFTKDIFSGNTSNSSERRWIMIGTKFCKAYRKKEGDKAFYEFLGTFNIQCGEDTYNYITKFMKKYTHE